MKSYTLADAIDELRIKMIRQALLHYQGNGSRAAEELGITRASISRWIILYGIREFQDTLKKAPKEAFAQGGIYETWPSQRD